MISIQDSFTVATSGRGMFDLTQGLIERVEKSKIKTGICQLFLHHTSASLVICENANQDVQNDLENFMRKTAPDGHPDYRHVEEGPDDMSAHIRTILTQSSLSLPITAGELALGRWQGIYLWEHRTQEYQRRVTMTLIGT